MEWTDQVPSGVVVLGLIALWRRVFKHEEECAAVRKQTNDVLATASTNVAVLSQSVTAMSTTQREFHGQMTTLGDSVNELSRTAAVLSERYQELKSKGAR